MSINKHVLLLTPGFAADESDSLCIPAIQDYLRYFNTFRPEVTFHIVTLHYPYKAHKYNWFGNEVISLGASGKRGPLRYLYRRRMEQIIREITDQQAMDAVHSLWVGEVSKMGARVAGKLNIPHVITVMGQDATEPRNIRSLTEHDRVVCLSTFQSMVFAENGGSTHTVVPWQVYPGEFVNVEKRYDLVGCGSLSRLKNWDLFIDILIRTRNAGKNYSAVIFGDGPERDRLERRIQKEKLNLDMPGNVSRNYVRSTMKKSSVFLHTSLYESFGMVLIEALDAGMTVFSTNVGAAADLPDVHIIDGKEDAAAILNEPERWNTVEYTVGDPRSMVDAYALLYQL